MKICDYSRSMGDRTRTCGLARLRSPKQALQKNKTQENPASSGGSGETELTASLPEKNIVAAAARTSRTLRLVVFPLLRLAESATGGARLRSPKQALQKKQDAGKSYVFWSKWRDSNSRPLAPETSTLPTALHLDKY